MRYLEKIQAEPTWKKVTGVVFIICAVLYGWFSQEADNAEGVQDHTSRAVRLL